MYSSEKTSALADAFREIRPALLAAGGLSVFINLLVFVSPLYTMQIYDRVLTSRNGMTLLLLSLIALALFISYAALEHFRSKVLVQTGLRFDEIVCRGIVRNGTYPGAAHEQLASCSAPARCRYAARCSFGRRNHIADGRPVDSDLSRHLLPSPSPDRHRGAFGSDSDPCHCVSQRAPHQSAPDRCVIQEFSCPGPVDLLASQRRSDPRTRYGIGRACGLGATHAEALLDSAKAGERGGSLLAISKFLRMAIQVAIMGVGAYLAINQEITGGVLFAASLIVGRALAPVEAAVSQWRALVSARTSFSRLDEALRTRATRRPR